MSQAELAGEGGVSLATIQNIEADRANPSMSTLRSVLEALGLTLSVEPEKADWEALAAFGLPLSGGSGPLLPEDPATLRLHIQRAAFELSRNPATPDRERKRECLQALLLAIHHHFPTRFELWFRRSRLIRDLLPEVVTGRLIKLERIALSSLAVIL